MKIKSLFTSFIIVALMTGVSWGAISTDTGIMKDPSKGVYTNSNCNQAPYFPIGVLCQDTDDGKLYKGTGSAVEEIASGGAVATDTIWAAAGDTVYGTGNDAAAILSKGTAYQLYMMNAGATAPAWTSILGVTGTRLTKGWFTDLESTNMPTVGGVSLASTFFPFTGGTMTGNLLFTDNTYDIGASGATRPRTGYFSTSVVAPVGTFSGAVTAASFSATRTTDPQALTLYEGTAGLNNFRKWTVPTALTADLTFLHPDAVPTAGQVLAWGVPAADISTGAFVTPILGTYGATANTIGKRGADATTVAASGITEDGTTVQLTALNLATTGQITGKIKVITKSSAYTLGTDSATELYGSMVIATGAMVLTLPDVDAAAGTGQSVCMYSTTAAAISIDPDAEDKIRLNGVLGAAGGILTSASGAGDFACVVLTDFASDVAHWTVFGKSGAWTQP